MIILSGIGERDFSCFITNAIPDYKVVFNGQNAPLYWYEENKNKQRSLFDEESNDDYIRRDGITDWILKEVRTRYGTREHHQGDDILLCLWPAALEGLSRALCR